MIIWTGSSLLSRRWWLKPACALWVPKDLLKWWWQPGWHHSGVISWVSDYFPECILYLKSKLFIDSEFVFYSQWNVDVYSQQNSRCWPERKGKANTWRPQTDSLDLHKRRTCQSILPPELLCIAINVVKNVLSCNLKSDTRKGICPVYS